MSIVIKTNTMKYKDLNGDYQGFNAIAQESTDQQLASIASAGQAQINAVQQKGEQTLESIPGDYTELKTETTDLKSAINDVYGELFDTIELYDLSSTRSSASSFSFDAVLKSGVYYTITVYCDTALAANCTVYFRNSSGNLNSIGIFQKDETAHTFENVTPNSDSTMIRFNTVMTGATYRVVVTTQKDNISTIFADITDINNRIGELHQKKRLSDLYPFEKAYWRSVDTFTPIAYRVGIRDVIRFDKTMQLSSVGGKALCGYLGGEYFTTHGVLIVPANTDLKLFVRDVWEDTSLTIDDIDTYTQDIYCLNYYDTSEYDVLKPTFCGIEMFKTAAFIGDSYTATRLGHSWVDIVGNKSGVNTAKYAKSGDSAYDWISDNANGLPALLADTAKDLYWIALGINDGDRLDNDDAYLGSEADLNGSYTDYPFTFWGNMGKIIESIQDHAPNAKIVLYKPIFQGVLRTLNGVSATKKGISTIRDAIGQVAEHYSLPVIDALDDVFFQSPFYAQHMDSDISAGTHPSVLLYPGIANANMRLFSTCVYDNADYFMGVSY